ncbi:alanine/ornithine racemase family PLP-dependent enzyme [Ilumatobacter nonamiensis]|uniref:alanine/ornithine racemase family PLP-dependent enzyme n=1 Tax=Ilumatobacter nonamiensis TaxID=467093 RepID=UPI00034CCBB1|nr:alanine/ornithine racemase family PLP-dependent enzyme [Ilumatobacter nonamiensis]
MSGLRLDIDLDKIGDNARHLVALAGERGVSITGVTKALLGDARLARTLVVAGVVGLGDSRIENIERMRHAHVHSPMTLIRSPMPSQVDRVARADTTSMNSDTDVLTALATAARLCGRIHDVIVMVELGDLRDGVMSAELHETVRHVLRRPTLRLEGIGTNLACRNGIEPSRQNMGELSDLADSVESAFGIELRTVSGGNSANLGWLSTAEQLGRVNNLRLGEAILLGRDPLRRQPLVGLHTDAITLIGEVIESRRKPSRPWGRAGQNAFGETDTEPNDDGGDHSIWQTIVAVGRQDTDPRDLRTTAGVTVLAASSDHLMVETSVKMVAGDEIRFEPGYSALLRSMTSPFVHKEVRRDRADRTTISVSSRGRAGNQGGTTVGRRTANLTIVPAMRPAAGAAPRSDR